MQPPSPLTNICRAMSVPEFYPHPVTRIERRETHISVVFLTGQWVYKLKKAKNLGFLDFRHLSQRKRFCQQEVILNQRLSRDIYQEVVDIFEDTHGRISLSPDGTVVEYAVKMVQLPEASSFASLLRQKTITQDQIAGLGETLAAFYETAQTGPHIDMFGHSELIRTNMEENFTQIAPFVENHLDADRWAFIRQVCRSFLEDHAGLFAHRVETGKIRDGHGDLRTDHVYFHNGIQIIDCIEFNERFRYGDCASDLAFLIMDLDHLACSDIGQELLGAFSKKSRDPEIFALVDFYAAYRALVRLKVACFALEQTDQDHQAPLIAQMRGYLNQAYHYAVMFGRPTLWIFQGLPASGKSTLAEKTAKALFLPVFASDVVRKQDLPNGTEEVVSFNTGLYQPVLRGRVYAELLNLAQDTLKNGKSVALDATFSDVKWQKAAVQLAKDMDVNFIRVQCVCKEQTMKERLKQREATPGQSDARLMHFEEIMKRQTPVHPDPPHTHITIRTDQPVDVAFYEVLAKAHAAKSAQTQLLLKGTHHD